MGYAITISMMLVLNMRTKMFTLLSWIGILKKYVPPMIRVLFIGIFPLVIGLMYIGIILLMADARNYGGDYPPFVLVGMIAAIAGLVFTIAHLDKDLAKSKQKLVRIGELYALAAVSLAAFGLLYPILNNMTTPFGAYCIPLILVVLCLVVFCLLSAVATYRFIQVLWEKRKAFFKDSLTE